MLLGRQRMQQPTIDRSGECDKKAKVGDRGWRPAVGSESVDDCTMTKAADDRLGGR
jgi:hypothetical protein